VSSYRLPVIYLAGAIRDTHEEDVKWRAQVIEALTGKAIFLNPLGGKVFNETTKKWTMSGIPAEARSIYKHDLWCVKRADIVLADVTALSSQYPNIGTLMELGGAGILAPDKMVYLILDPSYSGHGNQGMFKLHPFLQEVAAATFANTEEAIDFLSRHLESLSGKNPHFDGKVWA